MSSPEELRRFHVYAFEPNLRLINDAFATPDDIGRVLRVHLAIEQQMNALIEHAARRKVSRGTSFYNKLLALRCMQIDEWICDVVEKLNDLRNALAHNPSATLMNNKSIAVSIVEAVRSQMPLDNFEVHLAEDSVELKRFSAMDLGQQVVIVGAMLAAYLGGIPESREFVPPRFKSIQQRSK